jgi:hypothetical protein
MQIAGSYAEVLALLERLRGRYTHSRSERLGAVVTGAFFTVLFVTGGIVGPMEQGNVLTGVAIALLGPLFALWLIADQYVEIEISDAGIEKRLPVRGRAWHVRAGEIRNIDLSLGKGWYLKIDTAGPTRGIALFDSLQSAIALLYPEVPQPKPLPKIVGTIAYITLAVVVIAVVMTIAILAAKGLFQWR